MNKKKQINDESSLYEDILSDNYLKNLKETKFDLGNLMNNLPQSKDSWLLLYFCLYLYLLITIKL